MKKIFLFITVSLVWTTINAQDEQAKQMIMFIGDGFGTSAKVAARMSLGQGTEGKRFTKDKGYQILALDKLKYQGSLTTHSLNSWITDSGPGASAYSAGESGKLDNEAISYNVGKGESIETILEKAKKEGYAVGLVTSTRITHATPATFASHIWFRDLEDYIAAQFISSTQDQYEDIFNHTSSFIAPYRLDRDWILPNPKIGVEVDVLLGGGARHFLPNNYIENILDSKGNKILFNDEAVTIKGKRSDNVNLIELAKQRGFVHINSRDALLNIDISKFTPDNNTKLIGLFNASHNNYEQDRQTNAPWEPSLPEMTEMAIKILKAKGGKKGFFLMVEGGRIDHLEHANSGGITVITNNGKKTYSVDSDQPSYIGGGDAVYSASPSTERHTNVYGSDYLIKEVLSLDYSVAQARKLLKETNTQTLIFSASDHECGGTAIVGLHDSNDAQSKGTYIRTYALGPKQNGSNASSGGSATATTVANPAGVKRGDVDFGTSNPNGWYPNYTTYIFQDRAEELWPMVENNGRRIVVAYASNPLTNGNGDIAGGMPGNHTPMDVFVGAEDNINGKYAGKISGIGQVDNTYLTHIMEEFLLQGKTAGIEEIKNKSIGSLVVYPNPSYGNVNLDISLKNDSYIFVSINDITGKLVKQFRKDKRTKKHSIDFNTYPLTQGVYVVSVDTSYGKLSKKLIIQ